MFGKLLCGKNIPPACAYCSHGSPSADPQMILCRERKLVAPYYACREFRYDPLLRVPHRQVVPQYKAEDFSLE